MRLIVNGDPREVGARNIPDLLAELELPAPAMLVEHNGLALQRHEWPEHPLNEGDRVELIRIVAGG